MRCCNAIKPSSCLFLRRNRNNYTHITGYFLQYIDGSGELLSFSVYFPSDILPETTPPDFSFVKQNSRMFFSFFTDFKRFNTVEFFLLFIPEIKVFCRHRKGYTLFKIKNSRFCRSFRHISNTYSMGGSTIERVPGCATMRRLRVGLKNGLLEW